MFHFLRKLFIVWIHRGKSTSTWHVLLISLPLPMVASFGINFQASLSLATFLLVHSIKLNLVYLSFRFPNIWLVLCGVVISSMPNPPTWRPRVSLLVWVITFNLFGKRDPAIAFGITSPCKQHHVKFGIPSVESLFNHLYFTCLFWCTYKKKKHKY